MLHYFFKSSYRFTILGLILGLSALWYTWYRSDQILSSTLLIYVSGIALLNTVLGFFSYSRHKFVTRFLFYFSYGLMALAAYAMYSLSRGLHL